MTLDARINKVYATMTARERATLVLREWKEDRETDWRVTWNVPPTQVKEYNRLIGLMNGVNRGFGLVLLVLEQQITQVELKAAWLTYITYTGRHVRALAGYIFGTKEPITESGLQARTDDARAELLTLDEAAQLLTDEHEFADNEMAEADGRRYPTDAAWDRIFDEKREALGEAIGAGALRARGNGARARVAVGELSDWVGQPVYVMPEWGVQFDVRPDVEGDDVHADQAERELMRKVIRRICPDDGWPVDPQAMPDEPDREDFATGMAQTLACAVVAEIQAHWGQLRATEVVAFEVAEEFDGEDPFRRHNRQRIDAAKARLQKLADEMQEYVGDLVLQVADEATLAQTRDFLVRCDE